VSAFLGVAGIDQPPSACVAGHGRVERELSRPTQGSGNLSWIVEAPEGRLFIKTAGTDAPPPPGAPTPYFDHSGRVRLLRNAIDLARSCDHPALAALLNVIETPAGPMLACQAAPGELIGGLSPAERADPASAYQRFASLPVAAQLPVFDTLIDLHRVLAGLGWVACDLYDGCLIVDFSTLTLHVVDLDTYRRGPGRNDTGRMFGSRRFMAPEEFELGAPLDQRTTVFTLGHLVRHFTTGLTEDTGCFDGPAGFAAVVAQAVEPAPEDRFPTVAAFASASLGASSRVTAAAWQPVSAGAVVFAAMAGHQRRGPAGAGQPVSVTS
jgi:serine/threonine protein kinase, bacterial